MLALGAATPIKKFEDQLRRKTLDLLTRVSKFIEFFSSNYC
jgi:hypothetical protein